MPLNQKGNFLLIVGILFLLVVVGGGAYYLGLKKSNFEQVNRMDLEVYPSDTASHSPVLTSISDTPTVNMSTWETRTIPTLGLTFDVPPKIAELGQLKEEFSEGDVGYKFCILFTKMVSDGNYCGISNNPFLEMGTTSIDYTAGREGMFTDLEGFVYKDGKYLVNFVQKSPTEAFSQNRITKFNNPNGVEIIKIAGKIDFDEGPTLSNTLGNNTGALVNTKNQKYPGLAIIFKTDGGITEQEINQILKSFKFAN